jgi:hypothetical protein
MRLPGDANFRLAFRPTASMYGLVDKTPIVTAQMRPSHAQNTRPKARR